MTAPDPAGTGRADPTPEVRDALDRLSLYLGIPGEHDEMDDWIRTVLVDYGRLRAEVATLNAELEHARPVVQAAREYVERLRAGDWSYPGHETELLRALAARVAALSAPRRDRGELT